MKKAVSLSIGHNHLLILYRKNQSKNANKKAQNIFDIWNTAFKLKKKIATFFFLLATTVCNAIDFGKVDTDYCTQCLCGTILLTLYVMVWDWQF